jgi:ADP-heptose:LPS heptosyltransferase
MEHVGNKVYKKKINNFFLYYVERPNFYELIDLIRKSKLCITCHGSATHISSSFNNKTIDIIDGSKISLYRAYTSHLKNYNEIIREDSKTTTEKIFNLL